MRPKNNKNKSKLTNKLCL